MKPIDSISFVGWVTRYPRVTIKIFTIPFACAVPVKGMSAKCPLFHSDLGAIGAVAGN